jgi:phospho-N-acetylmuramoyl-pentapeptide-transferase
MTPAGFPLAFVASAVLTILFGMPLLRLLVRLKARQVISMDAPAAHQGKAGTPTMGGLIIFAGATVALLLLAGADAEALAVLVATLSFGLIGLVDDLLIVRRGRNAGLSERQKLILQIFLGAMFLVWIHRDQFLQPTEPAHVLWPRFLFQLLLLVGLSNAVNLTDGLDGLAAGLSAPVWTALGVLPFVSRAGEGHPGVAIAGAALAGACLAFLWFNGHPARVFMGDTGALGLGAGMAAAGILLHMEWLVIIITLPFWIDAGAAALQRYWFKFTRLRTGEGRRLFRRTPLHHHFEELGWPETRIVTRAWVIGWVLAMAVVWYQWPKQ